MDELMFLAGSFIGAWSIGWVAFYKLLVFKKAVESISTTS